MGGGILQQQIFQKTGHPIIFVIFYAKENTTTRLGFKKIIGILNKDD